MAYFSKKASEDESKLLSFELEALAVVYALERFSVYLDRLPFTLVTDCAALAQTLKKKDVNKRIARWALAFEGYNYKVQHRRGDSMTHVDALSRVAMMGMLEDEDVGLDSNIQITQSRDENIRSILDRLENGELSGYKLENGLV